MSVVICPTVLAANKTDFDKQIKKIEFAHRIQLDFMDGEFTDTKSVGLHEIYLPKNTLCDLHLMYKHPYNYMSEIKRLKPHLVIIHAESEVDHMKMAAELNQLNIMAGLCVLPETSVESTRNYLKSFDHLLIFGGHLGHFGGQADLKQLPKAAEAKLVNPMLEIGWDGGSNDKNAEKMVDYGVDVINVGGFIQNADDPKAAYSQLVQLVR